MALANQYVMDSPTVGDDMSEENTWHLLDPQGQQSNYTTMCRTPPSNGVAWTTILPAGQVPGSGYVCLPCVQANT